MGRTNEPAANRELDLPRGHGQSDPEADGVSLDRLARERGELHAPPVAHHAEQGHVGQAVPGGMPGRSRSHPVCRTTTRVPPSVAVKRISTSVTSSGAKFLEMAAVVILLHQPPAGAGIEAYPAAARPEAIDRAAPPPAVDLLGEEGEGTVRRARDGDRDQDGGPAHPSSPIRHSTGAWKASSWSAHRACTSSSQAPSSWNGSGRRR